MQETVSGYKFRIFHQCPGGRVWGRQAVVELAAWGSATPPQSTVPGRQGPISLQRMGSAPGSTSLGSEMAADNPAQRPEQGTPKTPCGFRPCDTTEAVEGLHGGSNKHPRQAG